MALCKFFQQGNCRYGNNCRFEHPTGGNDRNQYQNTNRFGTLGSGGGGAGSGAGGNQTTLSKYNISAETIEKDLTTEKPQWILSAYAPGRDAPGQLFGGYPREQSFEELRLHYMIGKASGNEQGALNQAQELYQTAEQQMQNAARNPAEAAQFIVQSENNHPNRLDICKELTQGAPFGEFLVGKRLIGAAGAQQAQQSNPFASNNAASSASPFGGGASQPSSTFGQPSALGQQANPFGAPSQPTSAFGQPAQPASAFGQPSQSSQASAFGQGAQNKPSFGQPSQPTSAFGQPSALGAKPSPFGAPAFGQPSQPSQPPAQASAFGQPSQLGQTSNPFSSNNTGSGSSPFATVGSGGNATGNAAANPFGAPSTAQNAAAPNPFGGNNNNNNDNNNKASSPFGQPAGGSTNPFGQPSTSSAAPNPFASTNQGPAAASSSPFGQAPAQSNSGFPSQSVQQQQTSNPFGQPSGGNTAFGQPSANPFGQPSSAPSTAANPFAAAQQQAQPVAAAATGPPGQPYGPDSAKQHPAIENYSAKGMDGRLTVFKGKPVSYKEDRPGIRAFDGTWTRIWFPNGPPNYYKDTELPASEYDKNTQALWASFAQTGTFPNGIVPSLPPPRECTQWDF